MTPSFTNGSIVGVFNFLNQFLKCLYGVAFLFCPKSQLCEATSDVTHFCTKVMNVRGTLVCLPFVLRSFNASWK